MPDDGDIDDGIHPAAKKQPPFAEALGVRMLAAAPNRVVAAMEAVPALVNRNGVLHGGALMGLADTVGGTGATLNLGPGEMTTTVESKCNFLRPVPEGDLLRAISEPLHLGRSTQLWQTTIYRSDGKVAAIVTQTQMTLRKTEA